MTAQYLNRGNNPNYNPYLQTTVAFGAVMIIFYGNFYLCHALFLRRKLIYFLCLAATMIAYEIIMYQLLNNNTVNGMLIHTRAQITALLIYFSFYFVILILLSGFYWSALFAARQIKENAQMQLDLQRMANEKMFAEKKFLQSQVNPHFLYNTLNFLYAKSLNGPAELSDGISDPFGHHEIRPAKE